MPAQLVECEIPRDPGRRRLLALAYLGERSCSFCGGGFVDVTAGASDSAGGAASRPTVDNRRHWLGLVDDGADEEDGGVQVLVCRTCKGWRHSDRETLTWLADASAVIVDTLQRSPVLHS